jgi:hypothetical protein
MNLCSDGHEEICYESKECPACEFKEEVEELKDEIVKLNEASDN